MSGRVFQFEHAGRTEIVLLQPGTRIVAGPNGEPEATKDPDPRPDWPTIRPLGAPRDTRRAAHQASLFSACHARERVLTHIHAAGPLGSTDEEGARALGMRMQTYTPRRGELVRDGRVRDSGIRRRTKAGRWAIVWVAA
jgi:hypothetical protein